MYLSIFQTPSRLEPVLADKEVLLTALNIKAMTFTGLDQDESETEEEDEDEIKANGTAGQCKRIICYSFKGQGPLYCRSVQKQFTIL